MLPNMLMLLPLADDLQCVYFPISIFDSTTFVKKTSPVIAIRGRQ